MPKQILIVDDDEDDRDLFCTALNQVDPDLTCSHACNGEDALHYLRKQARLPDYIFMDLNMPRLNGKQCLIALKKDPKLSAIPVVIYTTSKLTDDIEETKQLGAVHFITKPSSFKELCQDILFVLSHEWNEVNAKA